MISEEFIQYQLLTDKRFVGIVSLVDLRGQKICGDSSEAALHRFLHCRVLQRHSAHFFNGRAFQGS